MATTNFQSGGSFLPNTAANYTGEASNFVNLPTSGGTASGAGSATFVDSATAQTLTNKTLTAPTLTAPVISGAATLASGATITTPTILFTSQNVIATGATGGSGAAISAISPSLVFANGTGASGAGVDLATGAAVPGAFYVIQNGMTGVLKIYAVGGTINGATGTTAFSLTATGNKTAFATCSVAGAWNVTGNT